MPETTPMLHRGMAYTIQSNGSQHRFHILSSNFTSGWYSSQYEAEEEAKKLIYVYTS